MHYIECKLFAKVTEIELAQLLKFAELCIYNGPRKIYLGKK
jgi:hypothetical protein